MALIILSTCAIRANLLALIVNLNKYIIILLVPLVLFLIICLEPPAYRVLGDVKTVQIQQNVQHACLHITWQLEYVVLMEIVKTVLRIIQYVQHAKIYMERTLQLYVNHVLIQYVCAVLQIIWFASFVLNIGV